ncbi:MAG TPA: ATP-binding protein, partial [Pyrinomonadaceae bacterium]|nr:ATP-binding protein [Pyrinomonadaceae bacterium]
IIALHASLGLDVGRWTQLLRLTDTVAVVSITLSYSFLLHVHLHLWAGSHDRPLKFNERARVYLTYTPALFLFVAVPKLWVGEYLPMMQKLEALVLPFVLWAGYALLFVAVTDFLISRVVESANERSSMRWLAASFLGIGALLVAAYAFGVGQGTTLGLYLKTFANLGSLLPSALIAYYIYRYRYLELIIRESLIVAIFGAVVLAVYLFGIRSFGTWLASTYGLREGTVEALLILGLTLMAAPFRRWLENRFHQFFEREATLYRDVVARIGQRMSHYRSLPELLRFVEERAGQGLGLTRLRIVAASEKSAGSDKEGDSPIYFSEDEKEEEGDAWIEEFLELARADRLSVIEDEERLKASGYQLAYPLRRDERCVGLMLVSAPADALTRDVRAVLEVLAAQVAIAIEDYWLLEENVRLERKLAHGERLAALGRMAATVAHEVKNPLSAIKSIAQVMREDKQLAAEYERDLSLIVGETDRLNRSVTQLLSFARTAPPEAAPVRVDEALRATVELFRMEASARGIRLESLATTSAEIGGAEASALRDALANLLTNALQATPAGGVVKVEAGKIDEEILIEVADTGAGVKAELRERIWEPFFTTKQRGTGLGLAIVRKRMEEAGGRAVIVAPREGEGARFQLRLPARTPSNAADRRPHLVA